MKKINKKTRLNGELKMGEKFFQEVLKDLKKSNFVTTEQEILDSVENDTTGVFKEWLLTALEMHLYSGGKFIVDAETYQPLNQDFVRRLIIKIKEEMKMLKLGKSFKEKEFINRSIEVLEIISEIEKVFDFSELKSMGVNKIFVEIDERGIDTDSPACPLFNPWGVKIHETYFFSDKYNNLDRAGIIVHEIGHLYLDFYKKELFPEEYRKIIDKLMDFYNNSEMSPDKSTDIPEGIFCDYLACKKGFSANIIGEREKSDKKIAEVLKSWKNTEEFLRKAKEYIKNYKKGK